MSRNKLKKELQQFTRGQLLQLILDAYAARKEFKTYFDYFLNPDPEALFRDVSETVRKECARQKRNFSKLRVSVLKRCLEDFASYHPGDDYIQDLRLFIISEMLGVSSRFHTTDVQLRTFAFFVSAYVKAADEYGNLSEAVARLRELHAREVGARSFRPLLQVWE
ncbi:MAG: hypothetical protein K2L96_00985 [Muribaculaceae bacterium]|nr:hypothetical protein [Muribaculaceae bacterium]